MSSQSDLVGVDDSLEQSEEEMNYFVCDENGVSVLDHAIRNGHARF